MKNDELLNEVRENSRKRVIQLIQEFCDGNQQRFAVRTGLNKGAVSQYVNGKKAPTNLAASTIGEAFNVAPAWVMGFDVPMKPVVSDNEEAQELFDNEWELVKKYRALDERGKQAVHDTLDREYSYVDKK